MAGIAPVLRGLRRELTRETFEELAAHQCEVSEILGYVGTDAAKLEKWCRRVYRRPLADMMTMIRQDGLISIRRAAFDLMQKSAPMVAQQYSRFLSSGGDEDAARSREALKALSDLVSMPEDAVKEVLSTAFM